MPPLHHDKDPFRSSATIVRAISSLFYCVFLFDIEFLFDICISLMSSLSLSYRDSPSYLSFSFDIELPCLLVYLDLAFGLL